MTDIAQPFESLGPVMETRLFPKNHGAASYRTTGLAARCDLVIHSDHAAPRIHIERRGAGPVRTVYVSLRRARDALQTLVDAVLPSLDRPVIVISGSEDCTFPVQTDTRFPDHGADLIDRVYAWLDSTRVERWYGENLVGADHPKLSPIPLGLVFPTEPERERFSARPGPPLTERPARALCAHRVREGEQWALRRDVSTLALGPWRDFTTVPDGELDPHEFEAALHAHAFVICAEGGGVDPCPKAWHALLCGAIPIIRRTDLAPAYQRLPVVFVEDWSAQALDAARLEDSRRALIARYGQALPSPDIASKLELDYWWSLIMSAQPV